MFDAKDVAIEELRRQLKEAEKATRFWFSLWLVAMSLHGVYAVVSLFEGR